MSLQTALYKQMLRDARYPTSKDVEDAVRSIKMPLIPAPRCSFGPEHMVRIYGELGKTGDGWLKKLQWADGAQHAIQIWHTKSSYFDDFDEFIYGYVVSLSQCRDTAWVEGVRGLGPVPAEHCKGLPSDIFYGVSLQRATEYAKGFLKNTSQSSTDRRMWDFLKLVAHGIDYREAYYINSAFTKMDLCKGREHPMHWMFTKLGVDVGDYPAVCEESSAVCKSNNEVHEMMSCLKRRVTMCPTYIVPEGLLKSHVNNECEVTLHGRLMAEYMIPGLNVNAATTLDLVVMHLMAGHGKEQYSTWMDARAAYTALPRDMSIVDKLLDKSKLSDEDVKAIERSLAYRDTNEYDMRAEYFWGDDIVNVPGLQPSKPTPEIPSIRAVYEKGLPTTPKPTRLTRDDFSKLGGELWRTAASVGIAVDISKAAEYLREKMPNATIDEIRKALPDLVIDLPAWLETH